MLDLIFKVYKEGVFKVSLNCANQAAKQGIKRFIEVSTAQVYSGDKVSVYTKIYPTETESARL